MSTARRFVVVSDGVRREWSAERIYKTASRSCDPSADQPWPSGRGWRLVSHGTLRALNYAGSVSRSESACVARETFACTTGAVRW